MQMTRMARIFFTAEDAYFSRKAARCGLRADPYTHLAVFSVWCAEGRQSVPEGPTESSRWWNHRFTSAWYGALAGRENGWI